MILTAASPLLPRITNHPSVRGCLQEYMRERVSKQQFLMSIALESARDAHAAEAERRRLAATESTERFEKSFGYICERCGAQHAGRPTR